MGEKKGYGVALVGVKKGEMTVKQKLYSQKIYQVNQAIDEFKKECGLAKQLIGFCALNYYNRKFSWYVVHKDRWDFNQTIVVNIEKCCAAHPDEWKAFLQVLQKLKNETLNDSIKFFTGIVDKTAPKTSESLKNFHFHFLNIYQSYPIDSDKYFDGIVYRNFRRKMRKLRYATGETLSHLKDTYNFYPWLDITFCFEDDEKIRSFSCQESGKDDCDIKYESSEEREYMHNMVMHYYIKKTSFKHSDADKLYFYYLLPIVAGYNHPDSPSDLYAGTYCNEEKYLLDQSHVAPYKYILFIPVYDARIGKNLFGNFYGNITIPFALQADRDEFLKEHQKKIEENLFLLIR